MGEAATGEVNCISGRIRPAHHEAAAASGLPLELLIRFISWLRRVDAARALLLQAACSVSVRLSAAVSMEAA